MPAITTIIAAAGLAVAAGGAYTQYTGQQKQQSAQREALAQQQQIEQQRQKQMNLDTERRKRELIRQSIAQRGVAESAAGADGAMFGSGLQGAYGNISGRANAGELATNQNAEIGNNIFGLNEGVLGSYRSAASGVMWSSIGAGMSSLGGAALTNAGTLGKIGSYVGGQFNNNSGGGDWLAQQQDYG